MAREFDYENSNIGYDCQNAEEDGGGIKCKYYTICGSVLPNWWFEAKGHYLCTNCDMHIGHWKRDEKTYVRKGTLEINDNLECPICLDVKKCISQPRCEHSLCINCFKRCYYGDETDNGKPEFPYPDVESDYYDDPEKPKWDNDYPLIKIYNEELNKWEREREEKYENEEHLRKCPLCRK